MSSLADSVAFPGFSDDPEGMLEHGVVHLLRHRRQIERLLAAAAQG